MSAPESKRGIFVTWSLADSLGTSANAIPTRLPTTQLSPGGPRLPRLGLGCNSFGHNPFGTFIDYSRSKRVIDAAISAGAACFDTADVYGPCESEEYLGRALKGRDRAKVFIATKFGYEMPGAPEVRYGSRAYVRWAAEGSLRRLQSDYIDLFQIHRFDPDTPISETLGALGELIAEGKIRWVGSSMFTPEQLELATSAAERDGLPRIISCMMHYSLLERSNEAGPVAACIKLGVSVLPFFPLEGGLLTGKYRRDRPNEGDGRHRDAAEVTPEMWQRLTELERFADARGISLLELALGGLLTLPGVGMVFVGATTPHQVAANAQAVRWIPSPDDIAELTATGGWTTGRNLDQP
jgi:aryl-alcohol dehydrogenase-like predicted oxidoreductase